MDDFEQFIDNVVGFTDNILLAGDILEKYKHADALIINTLVVRFSEKFNFYEWGDYGYNPYGNNFEYEMQRML